MAKNANMRIELTPSEKERTLRALKIALQSAQEGLRKADAVNQSGYAMECASYQLLIERFTNG